MLGSAVLYLCNNLAALLQSHITNVKVKFLTKLTQEFNGPVRPTVTWPHAERIHMQF
jgi:hypothetical protein